MIDNYTVIIDEQIFIPADAFTFEGFLRWCHSKKFPETGRIDYLDGTIHLELNEVGEGADNLFTYNAVLTEIGARLHVLLSEKDLGEVFLRGAWILSPQASLSCTPDLTVVLLDSLQNDRVRFMGWDPDHFRRIEGAPDLIVEVLSKESKKRDTKHLTPLYAKAGIPELWLVDACRKKLRFDVFTLHDGQYEPVAPDADGWTRSPLLGYAFHLVRHRRPGLGTWRYRLEHREA